MTPSSTDSDILNRLQALGPPPEAPPQAVAPVSIPGAGQPMGSGMAVASSPKNPSSLVPLGGATPAQPSPHAAEYSRLTAPPLSALPAGDPNRAMAHTSADTGQSGIGQIKSPWARIPLQVLEGIGSMFGPTRSLEMALPGTQAHHNVLVRQAAGAENQDTAQQKAASETALQGAETAEHQAQVPHIEAETNRVNNPLPKEEMEGKTIATKEGIFQWNPHTEKYDIKAGDAPEKEDKGAVTHFFDKEGNAWLLNHDGSATPIKGPGGTQIQGGKETPAKTEVRNVMVGGKPHQVLFNAESGEQLKDLGETGEKPPTVNVNAETSALDRESARFGKTHEANVKAANDQLEKIIEARTLLNTGSAEAQALAVPKVLTALVSGQGTGVRVTQPELNVIASARGIKGDFQAWVQKISSGKRLTPEQSQQLTAVLDDAAQRIGQKREIANSALDRINSAGKREDIVQADKEARKALTDMEKGGATGPIRARDPQGKLHEAPAGTKLPAGWKAE